LAGLGALIDAVYDSLNAEELLSKVKEGSWQTFFHHSASVAAIAYRLGKLLKKGANGVAKLSIKEIEERVKCEYENILFLSGLAHDFAKVFGVGEEGRKRIREILEELPCGRNEGLAEVIENLARTAEASYTPELDENLLSFVSPVIRVADTLMSLRSVDEAIPRLESSNEVRKLKEFGIRFGFVKTSPPSILQIKISRRVVELLKDRGWIPLAVYYDGLVVAGDPGSRPVRFSELYEKVVQEISSVFGTEALLKEIVGGLKKRALLNLYQLLEQAKEPLKSEEGVDDRTKVLYYYHAIITEYLNGNLNQAAELFKGLKKTIDPRTMATGLRGKGSIYFADELRKAVTTSESIADFIARASEEERFLLLAYLMAYPSEDAEPLGVEGLRPLANKVPRGRELLRILSIAEAYKLSKRPSDEVKAKVGELLKHVRVGVSVEPYIRMYLSQTIKSNVIEAPPEPPTGGWDAKAFTYCRICGTPLVDEGLRFIDYARDLEALGGASEIWLPDDVPLGDLESIAKEARRICPLCYYEARQLKGRYSPPFLVLAFHPVVAYDLWLWVEGRVSSLAEVAPRAKERTRDFAELLAGILESSGKLSRNSKEVGEGRSPEKLLEKLVGELRGKGRKAPIVLLDSLGARVVVSAGGGYAVKRKNVALLLTVAPLLVSVAGGGQVGIVATLADSYNLGSGQTPIQTPHPVAFVNTVVELFEGIRMRAIRERRDLRAREYAVYNRSYFTVLLATYIYGLKVLGWWSGAGGVDLEDYAHEMLTFTYSIPYLPLALSAPPPPRLDPRRGADQPLQYFGQVILSSRRVEELMGQARELAKGERPTPVDRVLWDYAVNLAELDSGLSRYAAQKPLRRAIELLLQYAEVLGEESAKNITTDIFLQQVALTAGVDLDKAVKKVKDNEGKEKEESYRVLMYRTFRNLADAILTLRKELPPQHFRGLVEVLLDSAYEKYRWRVREERKKQTQPAPVPPGSGLDVHEEERKKRSS